MVWQCYLHYTKSQKPKRCKKNLSNRMGRNGGLMETCNKKVLFSGCSYTAGTGLTCLKNTKNDPNLWVNLLHKDLFFDKELLNISVAGNSNSSIFKDTMWHILNVSGIDTAIVQWSSMPRINFNLGFELYDSSVCVMPSSDYRDYYLNDITYSKKYLKSICDRFIVLPHDQKEIVDLLQYVNALKQVCKLKNIRLFLVNGLCPWDHNFFTHKDAKTPDLLSAYTQQILNIKNRDDDEIFSLYKKMHNEFKQAGGVNEKCWVNLYSSMRDLKIDVGIDDAHPGIGANLNYARNFSEKISNIIN